MGNWLRRVFVWLRTRTNLSRAVAALVILIVVAYLAFHWEETSAPLLANPEGVTERILASFGIGLALRLVVAFGVVYVVASVLARIIEGAWLKKVRVNVQSGEAEIESSDSALEASIMANQELEKRISNVEASVAIFGSTVQILQARIDGLESGVEGRGEEAGESISDQEEEEG